MNKIFLPFLTLITLAIAIFGCETELKLETHAVNCGTGPGEMDCGDMKEVTSNGFGLRILSEALITNTDNALIKWEEEPGATSYTVGLYTDNSCTDDVVSFRQAETEKNVGILRDNQYYSCVWAHIGDKKTVPAENNGISLRVDRIAPVIDNSAALSVEIISREKLSITARDATTMSYSWQQLKGPGQLLIAPDDAAETTITGNTNGLYQIEFLVTDAAGNITVFVHEFNLYQTSADKNGDTATNESELITNPTRTLTEFSITSITNGDKLSTNSPNVTWSASEGASRYDLLIGTTASCATPIQSHLGISELSVTATSLPEGSYYLCLTAHEGSSFSLGAPEVQFSVDTTAPTINSVSSTTADGSYTVGDVINISISFDSPVLVMGSPTLGLNTSQLATYVGGSGTAALAFSYTVQAGDNTADLNYQNTTALQLGLSNISDEAGNPSIVTLPVLSAAGSLGAGHDIIVDTTAPEATITGEPIGNNNISIVTVNVAGAEVSHYKYKVGTDATTNCALTTGYSDETPVINEITEDISTLADGGIELCVVGRDLAGNWQLESIATRATWNRDSNVPTATASGQPSSSSNVTNITAAVSGSTVTHYKHKLGSSDSIDCAASTGYSVETAVATPIAEDISSLAEVISPYV